MLIHQLIAHTRSMAQAIKRDMVEAARDCLCKPKQLVALVENGGSNRATLQERESYLTNLLGSSPAKWQSFITEQNSSHTNNNNEQLETFEILLGIRAMNKELGLTSAPRLHFIDIADDDKEISTSKELHDAEDKYFSLTNTEKTMAEIIAEMSESDNPSQHLKFLILSSTVALITKLSLETQARDRFMQRQLEEYQKQYSDDSLFFVLSGAAHSSITRGIQNKKRIITTLPDVLKEQLPDFYKTLGISNVGLLNIAGKKLASGKELTYEDVRDVFLFINFNSYLATGVKAGKQYFTEENKFLSNSESTYFLSTNLVLQMSEQEKESLMNTIFGVKDQTVPFWKQIFNSVGDFFDEKIMFIDDFSKYPLQIEKTLQVILDNAKKNGYKIGCGFAERSCRQATAL